MAEQPKQSWRRALCAAALGSGLLACCARETGQPSVDARFDKDSGQLSQLTINQAVDGKPNIVSHMDGRKFLRIEVDVDEDGRTDRWEYYAGEQRLQKVGFSRANDGNADYWVYQGSDGSIERVEVSTRHDGNPNRTEFYDKGFLTRAEEDTDADGRVDKWERYESGALVSVSLDTASSGKPTTTIDYRKP